jgi:hypothetical protein
MSKEAQKVRNLAQGAGEIYSTFKSEGADRLDKIASINPDIELIYITDELTDNESEKKNEYRCAVTLNHKTKEITFITAGTRMEEGAGKAKSDIVDDVRMAFGYLPKKFESAQKMNDTILHNLGDKISEYRFHYTGHSLGAALSDLAATDMALKLNKRSLLKDGKVSAVTFENPGSHTLVKGVLKKEGIKLDDTWRDKVSYKAFNNRPNFINTMDKQTGDTYRYAPKDQGDRNIVLQFVGWVASKCPGKVISKILQMVSFGRITTQVTDHGSKALTEAIVKGNGTLMFEKEGNQGLISVEDAARGIEPMKHDKKLFDALKEVAKTEGKEKPKYSMRSEHGDERLEFTAAQLKEAKVAVKNKPWAERTASQPATHEGGYVRI